MSSVSRSNSEAFQQYSWSFCPEAIFDDEDLIEEIKKETTSFSMDNRSRGAWYYLTLGIPLLIEAFSVFCEGLIHREKFGLPLRVRFLGKDLSPNKITLHSKIHKFNEIPRRALNDAEYNKALQLLNHSINEYEQARQQFDNQSMLVTANRIQRFTNLLEKNNSLKSRKEFDEENWGALDVVDFDLTKEHFTHLTKLFNSSSFKNSGISQAMKTNFDIDYNESLIAETLSLSLAYIEGIDGQSISLPIHDALSNSYKLVPFVIKETRLGDALPCYVLESDEHGIHPWFVIRGTQYYTGVSDQDKEFRTGSLESILADALDHECISRNLINKALVCRPIIRENGQLVQKESLSDIFRRWQENHKTAILCGHSLGGTLVNALAVEFFDQVKKGYSFSGAGVSTETASRWFELIKQEKIVHLTKHSKLINFDFEGDIVPSGGRRLIGNHFAIEALATTSNRIYDCHVRTHLNRDFQIQKIDTNRENRKFARTFCEQLRIIIGRCFRILLSLFSSKYVPDWWKNRKIYIESAAIQRKMRSTLKA